MNERITVRVAVSGKNFGKAVSYAKGVGGTYNPQAKTWSIPAQWQDNARLHGLLPTTATQQRDPKCTCPAGALGGVCTCC